MTPRRRPVVRLFALLIGVVMIVSCSRFGNPGKEEVTDEIAAVWEDLGVDADEPSLLGYGIDRQSDSDAETSDWCRDRDQADRWIADRSAILGPRVLDQDTVIEGLAARYRRLGADPIRLFRSTAGSDGAVFYALDLERGFAVNAHISSTGYTSLFVRHSRCPLDGTATEPDGPYEEAEVPGG